MNFSIPSHCAPAALVAFGPPGDRTAGDFLADVDALAEAVAAACAARPQSGEVLIICSDRYHFAVALLAVWKAGRIAALPPNGQPATVHALAAQPSIGLLLHDTDAAEGLDLRRALARRPARALAVPRAIAPLDIAPERIVATLYTSGSTGEHKRCPKAASELLGEAMAHVASFHIAPGARFAATVPGHHIYGLLWGVLVPLLSGGAFLRQTPFYPDAVAARVEAHGADWLVSVPAHLRGLAELDHLPAGLRITSSSAPLPAETAQKISKRFGLRVIEIFGSSETGGIAFRDAPGAPHQPLTGVRVSADAGGRLLLDSPFLPRSAPRPMACDDRIELFGDGRFALLGRLDGVVKVGGKRIALAEIERRLLQIGGVRDAACLAEAVTSGRGTEIWAACAAPGMTARQIRDALQIWLDPVTIPRRIEIVEALPREENGKLSRARLRALFAPSAAKAMAADAARAGQPQRFADAPAPLTPLSEAALEDGCGYVLTFHIPGDFYYFRGHFDGLPILPGVVQLEMIVRRQIARLWPDLAQGLRRIAQLKFKQTIEPGADLTLTLRRDAAAGHRVRFELSVDGKICSQGLFCF